KSISIKLCKTKRINKLTLLYSIATLFLRGTSTIYASGKLGLKNACGLQSEFSSNKKCKEHKERSQHKSKINESLRILEYGCLRDSYRIHHLNKKYRPLNNHREGVFLSPTKIPPTVIRRKTKLI